LVYDSLRIRGSVNYKAYNYSGMSIINTAILRTYKKNYVKSKNFEIDFFGRLIKSKKTKLIKAKGFWHSIDNMKDLYVVDKKTKNNQKFNEVKFIKNLINKK
jgi:NDP-sugar pyrophosphorylase family protein